MFVDEQIELISKTITTALPTETVDGKLAISEMKSAGGRWKDKEWQGFYTEHTLAKNTELKNLLTFPGEKYGFCEFDAKTDFEKTTLNIDFKTHSNNATSNEIILNDERAVRSAIEKHGALLYVVINHDSAYDDVERGSMWQWHMNLKGRTDYSLANQRAGKASRLMKTEIQFTSVDFYFITESDVDTEYFYAKAQPGKNSDGSDRNHKFYLSLNKGYKPNRLFV